MITFLSSRCSHFYKKSESAEGEEEGNREMMWWLHFHLKIERKSQPSLRRETGHTVQGNEGRRRKS
jgi:hypothetical protein